MMRNVGKPLDSEDVFLIYFVKEQGTPELYMLKLLSLHV